jgi:DNA (cytosine-5)-methyltransferase 1
MGGNNQPLVLCIGNGQKNITSNITEGLSGTLNCMHDQLAIMVSEEMPHTCEMIVRRLTPVECERLQGYPDGWTDIGDWTDSKGKKHKGDSNSPRYRALGNSIALPFWQWMAARMVSHIDHSPTMGSLFDGIGGFPLVYQRRGCKPVWASEIEEFCIAVTKKRFEGSQVT